MTALILEAHIAALSGRQRFGDLLSESLRLYFNIDVKFPDRNSQDIFNIYRDRIDHDETISHISMDTESNPTNKRKQKDLSPTNDELTEPEPKQQRQKPKRKLSKSDHFTKPTQLPNPVQPEPTPTPVNSPMKFTSSRTHDYDPIPGPTLMYKKTCLLYTSDAADE